MNTILTALAQINTTVGALDENCALILERARTAASAGAQLIIFPELALSGYPPEDLMLKLHFLADCERKLIDLAAALPKDICAIVGAPQHLDAHTYNTAAVLHDGEIMAHYQKNILPNYGVFDEKRVFEAGTNPLLLSLNGALLAVHVCEDSWRSSEADMRLLQSCGISALVNISASPFHRRRVHDRAQMAKQRAREIDASFIYTNLVGGQDELVFDGASMVAERDGTIATRAEHFEEDILYYSLPVKPQKNGGIIEQSPRLSITLPDRRHGERIVHRVSKIHIEEEEVYSALKLGLRDYVVKNRFEDVVIAISGGIDSALVAAIAVDALGPEHVTGVTMPSHYTSEGTLDDAQKLAENLGIDLHTLPIRPLYDLFIDELAPLWPDAKEDTTEENLQARIRGVITMAISNKFGQLVLSTGNKSELAVGYCTLYGDMVGGFTLLKDIPKTMVFALSRWRNRQGDKPVIPPSTISRPPSAELRADQKDSDSLPPYEILDPILDRYIELDQHIDEIIEAGFDRDIVDRIARLVDFNEYKRRQGAPGIKITPKSFGRDRRMPITNRYRPISASRQTRSKNGN